MCHSVLGTALADAPPAGSENCTEIDLLQSAASRQAITVAAAQLAALQRRRSPIKGALPLQSVENQPRRFVHCTQAKRSIKPAPFCASLCSPLS